MPLTYATPRLALMVVKGYEAISTVARVAEQKNVDLPTLGLPTMPICMVSISEYPWSRNMIALSAMFQIS